MSYLAKHIVLQTPYYVFELFVFSSLLMHRAEHGSEIESSGCPVATYQFPSLHHSMVLIFMSNAEVGPREGKLTIHFFVEAQNYRGNEEILVEYCLRIMGNGN